MSGVLITITNEPVNVDDTHTYDYSSEDRILKNIHRNEYEIFYSGQNQGGLDHQLINAIDEEQEFKIYYRHKKKTNFIYLGKTNISSVIQYRTKPVGRGNNTIPSERLQIHLVVKEVENELIVNNNFTGARYKKGVLTHAGLPLTKNTNLGFYTY
jgi:hypothetical protein